MVCIWHLLEDLHRGFFEGFYGFFRFLPSKSHCTKKPADFPQETGDLFTFAEEILNGKPHFLCSVPIISWRFRFHVNTVSC